MKVFVRLVRGVDMGVDLDRGLRVKRHGQGFSHSTIVTPRPPRTPHASFTSLHVVQILCEVHLLLLHMNLLLLDGRFHILLVLVFHLEAHIPRINWRGYPIGGARATTARRNFESRPK